MNKYALCVVMYAGDKFPPAQFIFEANNDEKAEKLAYKWAIYQGYNYRLDVIVRPAKANELQMNVHNEYVYSDGRK